MAKARKTFDVGEFRNWVNSLLDNDRLSQDEKRALCMAVEHALHETNNYKGYNQIYWMKAGYQEWQAAGEPGFPEKQKFLGLEYDRHYF